MEEKNKNYYNTIKDKLIQNEIYSKVKDHSKEKHRVITYFEIGKLLNEAGKQYGNNIIEEYSKKLMIEVGKQYNRSTLFRMKQFYNVFSNEKVAPLVQQLSWSHYLILLPIKNIDKFNYYIRETVKRNLSKRQLNVIVKNKEYERLSDKTKIKLINNEKEDITDFIKEPIILNKHTDYEKISEMALKEIILNDLDNFLKQLGNGFCYIANEYKIKIGNNYNYIDILLFNIIFNCYVVVELKINKLTKQDIGQIEVYMNYINENVKNNFHSKTIGIIVCHENNKYLIKYASDPRIHVTTYEFV